MFSVKFRCKFVTALAADWFIKSFIIHLPGRFSNRVVFLFNLMDAQNILYG
jgi:hypothetical protein